MTGILGYITPYVVSSAAWATLVFILLYTWLAPWWRNPFGRMIVFLDAALFFALLPGMLHDDFAVHVTGGFWDWLVVTAVGTIPVVIVYRIRWLWRLQGAAYRVRNEAVAHALSTAWHKVTALIYPPDARP
jgi:hypothetical protein